jgi:hypothetical protein
MIDGPTEVGSWARPRTGGSRLPATCAGGSNLDHADHHRPRDTLSATLKSRTVSKG